MPSGAFTTINRRGLLCAGASALAGCATAQGLASPAPQADSEFRDFVARLAGRSRVARPFLLRRFDTSRLTPDGRILHDAIADGVEADAALSRFSYGNNAYPYAVTHRNGLHLQVSRLAAGDDIRRYARALDRETARLEADTARGATAPDFLLDATISSVEAAQAHAAGSEGANHVRLAEALTRQILALRRLRSAAQADAGMWRLPEGEAYYALTLRFHLGAPVDPHEAHERAWAHCHALHAEADRLLRAHGLASGGVGERLRALAAEDAQLYPDGSEGKAAAIADMTAQLERTRERVRDAFTGMDIVSASVRMLPQRLEAGGAQGRRRGAVYYADLGAIRTRPRWSLPSMVHHEVLPGHILLAPFVRNAAPPALQERHAHGYGEGWSIYAEQLADEFGAFDGDPLARLGYIQWRLFRLARVIADTGIHARRWSRARAIEEMRYLQGDSIAFVSIEDDVSRICAQPGLAAAHGLAALHLAQLREDMRRERRGFSLAQFHHAVLRYGPLSPPGLERAVRRSA